MSHRSFSSLTGNEDRFSILRTPDDDEPQVPCQGCGLKFWSRDDLSKKGYCRACCENQSHDFYCNNCYNDWTQIGIPTVCPVCTLKEFYCDDRFVDDLVQEKRKHIPELKFLNIVLPAALLAFLSL